MGCCYMDFLLKIKGWIIFLPLVFFVFSVNAQTKPESFQSPKADSTRNKIDTLTVLSKPKKGFLKHEGWPKPGRAARLSLLLPGLGQIYNRRYWKVPLVYGAIGAVGYFALNNHQQYLDYKSAYQNRTDNDPATTDLQFPTLSDENVRLTRDNFRRNRDFNIILMTIFYALNSVEAYVDAHLRGFTVSDNLSLKVLPAAEYSVMNGFQTGIKFSFQFKEKNKFIPPVY